MIKMFTKVVPEMYLRKRKNCLDFGSHLPPDPNLYEFKKDSSQMRDGAFFQNLIRFISPAKKLIGSS